MRYVTYQKGSGIGVAVLQDGQLFDTGAQSLIEVIRKGGSGEAASGNSISLSEARLLAPISNPPKNIMCIGKNYTDHVAEMAGKRNQANDIPEFPIFFSKAHNTIIGPDDAIEIDAEVSQRVDWEAELGVIIGKGGRHISEADALSHVFGYTCINDVTARDFQENHKQWFLGKSMDTFCPMGPWVVTADEVGDPQNLSIQLRVNGETKQQANTSMMIFNVAKQIAWLSKSLTLEPGDVIATGTPNGVGDARKPPEYLKSGDVVEVDIEKIGVLRNSVKSVR